MQVLIAEKIGLLCDGYCHLAGWEGRKLSFIGARWFMGQANLIWASSGGVFCHRLEIVGLGPKGGRGGRMQ